MIDEQKLIEFVGMFGEYCAYSNVLRYIEELIGENDESTM